MSHTPHDLHVEFPEHADKLHELKLGNAHFVVLADRYHEVNHAIHRAETNLNYGELRGHDPGLHPMSETG
jgi:uncharacterized protein